MSGAQSEQLSTDCNPGLENFELQILSPTNETATSGVQPLDDSPGDRASEFPGIAVPVQNYEIRQDSRHVEQQDVSITDINQSIQISIPSIEPNSSFVKDLKGKRSRQRRRLMPYPVDIESIPATFSPNPLNLPEGPAEFTHQGELVSIEIEQLSNSENSRCGGFGKVFSIVLKGSADIPIAVKCIPHGNVKMSEVEVMKEVAMGNCAYIVDYYCALVHPVNCSLYICMEFMDASLDEFYKVMHAQNQLDLTNVDKLLHRIVHDIASGLRYMETKEIIHRDIKPANLLINKDSFVKLCDFGISRTFTRMSLYCGDARDTDNVLLSPLVHTQNYMPPRTKGVIQDDMWSFGISLLEVGSGKNPFVDWIPEGRSFALIRWEPVVPGIIFPDMQELILNLLEKETIDRPRSYIDILDKSFICNVSETPSNRECVFVRSIIEKIS